MDTPLGNSATNIARMFTLLSNDATQKVVYIRGVGTSGILDKVVGGPFGGGTKERVQVALDHIDKTWNRGDDICIFGFSRGATAARMLAQRLSEHHKNVRFLGLFDTVASLGVPESRIQPTLSGFDKRFPTPYSTIGIPDTVKTCVHLVALDEDRMAFLPTLISLQPVNTSSRKEIWFSGNHGDIGGGWDESTPQRRQITLRYMLAQEHGLRFRLGDAWVTHSDVSVNPINLGMAHGWHNYSKNERWGGRQSRTRPPDVATHLANKYFPVPYCPRTGATVVHRNVVHETAGGDEKTVIPNLEADKGGEQ